MRTSWSTLNGRFVLLYVCVYDRRRWCLKIGRFTATGSGWRP
jgi:hypothetical protein